MAVNVQRFIQNIGKDAPPPIILFTGGKAPFGKEAFEPYLADVAIDKMIAAHVEPDTRDLALTIAYADETEPGELAEDARTLPFLVEKRVILLRNADVFANISKEKMKTVAPLLDCLESPSETTVLMMVAPGADRRKRFFKLCEKNGVVVECPQLDDRALGTWIRDQVAERNLSISSGAVAALIDRVGGRLADMLNAINLVVNFASGTSVTEADVESACADVAEATVWALTDAIAQSNTKDALEALHELLAMNKSFEELMGMINWLLETAYRTHPDTLPAPPKPFVKDKVMPLAQKFGVSDLKAALALCTRTHFSLRTTGADQHLLLEILVVKLAAPRGGSRKRVRRHTRTG